MCCFPLGFSDLAIKVMRDGDGDGRCEEEDGKWVPCPPGVASGTRLRNGKPLGQTLADMASAPAATKPTATTTEQRQSPTGRTLGEAEARWLSEDPDLSFSEWEDLFSRAVEPEVTPQQDETANDTWRRRNERYARLWNEFLALRNAERRRRREQQSKKVREEQPELFDENGDIKEEVVQEYLQRQREASQRFAEQVKSAQSQISEDSKSAARTLFPLSSGRVTERDLIDEYEMIEPRPERQYYDDGADGQADFDEDMRNWERDREWWVDDQLNGGSGNVTADDADRVSRAFSHTFKGVKSGKTYKSVVVDVAHEDGVLRVEGEIVDERGRSVAEFTRSVGDIDGTGDISVYHDSLSVSDTYQGDGIATSFNALNEVAYREMGADKIKVTGASGGVYNGATHWPAMGFNWTPSSKDSFLDAMTEALDYTGTDIQMFRNDAEREILRALIEAAAVQDENFDEDLIVAGDLVRWPGATAYFRKRGLTISYERWID